MPLALLSFVALVGLAWGASLVTAGAGDGAFAWVLREQTLNLSGLLAIALMSLAMILATRPTWLERPLGGIDRAYRLHKWAGILAAVFAGVHWLVEMSDDILKALFGRAGRPRQEPVSTLLDALRDAGEALGEFAIYLLLGLVILTLWRRFPYKFWRHLHRLMPAIYLMLAFHAAALAPLDYWTQPVGALLAVLLGSGSLAALWSMLGRIGRRRRLGGRLLAVRKPGVGVVELECELDAAWRGHRAGQFAYLGFDSFEGQHPFTIASADHGDRRVIFRIKGLGDFTRGLGDRLRVGQALTVEGPYGRFLLDRCDRRARQLWIAGGIGITPFMAWLDALGSGKHKTSVSADLHYAIRSRAEDPFVADLESRCEALPGVTLHVHESACGDALTASRLAEGGDLSAHTEVWFCGPAGLAKSLYEGLKPLWRRRFHFHQEVFEMR